MIRNKHFPNILAQLITADLAKKIYIWLAKCWARVRLCGFQNG